MYKYIYPLIKWKIKPWLKYYIVKKGEGTPSEIITTASPITLVNSLRKKFIKFIVGGNSIQDGEPSPTNEVPIKNVGDNVNIFDKSSTPIYKDQVETQEIETGVRVTTQNTGTYHMALYLLDTVASLKGKKITVSANIVPSSSNLGGLGIMVCDADGSNRTAIAQKNNITGKQSLTAKIEESYDDNKVIALRLYSNLESATAGDYIDYEELKAEEGTEATPYSPYNCGNVEVKVENKNLFSKNKGITFTTTSNTNYIRIQFKTTELDNMQLEQGSTATTYEPHEEQTAIFPLEEGQVLHLGDTIEDKIVQRRKTTVFDGTEDWAFNGSLTTPTNRTVFLMRFIGIANNYYLSNYFIYGSTSSNKIAISASDQLLYLSLDDTITGITSSDSNTTKVEKLKDWLSKHHTTLEYELETPIETEFTEAQRTAKAQIDSLHSYKGTTYISTSNDPSPIFEVQYYMEGE